MARRMLATRAPDRELTRDLPTLALFVGIWCEDHHAELERRPWEPPRVVAGHFEDHSPVLCEPCRRVLGYAIGQRLLCPLDPKPTCKKCPTPCYRDEHRRSIRRIMRHSGWRLIRRGRLDLLAKLLF